MGFSLTDRAETPVGVAGGGERPEVRRQQILRDLDAD
jgi:hypothetical protein